MGVIRALCISGKDGTQKYTPVRVFFVTEHGIDGDAYAGDPHRQVHLLGSGEIDDICARGTEGDGGAFGWNLVAEGFRFQELPPGTRLRVGQVFLEIMQIDGGSAVARTGGFARVLHGGWVTVGDELEITTERILLDAAVLTASDQEGRGGYEDEKAAAIRDLLAEEGYTVAGHGVLPDAREEIMREISLWADRGVGLVLTTGGTGGSARDVTAEETACEVPGVSEAMRALSMSTRAAAGIKKRTLIVNLPGSEEKVRERLGFILPELRRCIDILRGDTGE
ncbi:MAG: molybdopterin-binding protein [Selenomonas artemidis]